MLCFSLLIFIQIVSETFPISSSGHVVLMRCLMEQFIGKESVGRVVTALLDSPSLLFIMHVPTIIIVAFFFRKIWQLLLFRLFSYRYLIIKLIGYAFIADSITFGWYLFFILYPLYMPLYIGFSITMVLLFSLRWCVAQSKKITLWHMVLLGCAQGIALVPGVSRFASVYVLSRWLGIRGSKAFRVAWMIQWPLMVGSLLLGTHRLASWYMFMKSPSILVSIVSASFFSLYGFYVMEAWSRKNDIWRVSMYMIVPILLALVIGC